MITYNRQEEICYQCRVGSFYEETNNAQLSSRNDAMIVHINTGKRERKGEKEEIEVSSLKHTEESSLICKK